MTGLVPSTGVKDQDELEVESREYLWSKPVIGVSVLQEDVLQEDKLITFDFYKINDLLWNTTL